MLIEDFEASSGPSLRKSHLNKHAEFDELTLNNREGRKRLIYVYNMECLQMHKSFKEIREKK